MVATTTCTGASHSGKLPGIMLDQDADEALERAQDGAVQHHRACAWRRPRRCNGASSRSGRTKSTCKRAALPVAADGVAQHEFQLRAVEGAFAGVERQSPARRPRRRRAAPPRPGPRSRRVPARIGRPVREFHAHVGEAEIGIDRFSSSQKATVSAVIWSSVQKMCASSWVKARTRMMPCSAPDGS